MSFAIGLEALKKLCESQDKLAWQRAKLVPQLFTPNEKPIYEWMASHLKEHHALPSPATLHLMFSEMAQVETPEPVSYYLSQLKSRYSSSRLSDSMQVACAILNNNHDDHEKALNELLGGAKDIQVLKYRPRILDMGEECPDIILSDYHNVATPEKAARFGWAYLDQQSGGVLPGDVVSIVEGQMLGRLGYNSGLLCRTGSQGSTRSSSAWRWRLWL